MAISWLPQDPVNILSCRSVILYFSCNYQAFCKINRANNNVSKHCNNGPLWTLGGTVCAERHSMIQGVSEQPTGPSLPKL